MRRLESADDGPDEAEEGAADEDTFAMPESWRRAAHPRRGAVNRAVKPVDRGALKAAEGLVAAVEGSISRAAAHPKSDPRVIGALREHLAGQPNPLGAAAVAAIAGYRREVELGPFADAWVSAHGLGFAAQATVELFDPPVYSPDGNGTYVLGRSQTSAGIRHYADRVRAVADRLRALLAVTGEATYQEAVSLVARIRKPGREGVAAAYLLPTEQAWVDEYCDSIQPVTYYDTAVLAMLYESMGSPDQADKLGWEAHPDYRGVPLDLMATMADAMGPAVAALFAHELSQPWGLADATKVSLNALTELPTDAAFAVLIEHASNKFAQPSLRSAARRYPRRAIRMLAEAALGSAPESAAVKQLLAQHVAVHRTAAEAVLPDLGEDAAALVGRHLATVARAMPDADPAALPAILVSPPWSGRRPAAKTKAAVAAAVAEAATVSAAEAVLPKRLPVIGDWIEIAALPQIPVGAGIALPAESVKNLIMLLALSRPGGPFPGTGEAKAACDSAGLAQWAWALFEQWCLAGTPAKDGWVLHALGLLGDDDTAARLTPVIRAWPGEGGHQRAVTGLDVLAAIGTDAALRHLYGISQRVPFTALKARARLKISELAESLGLTAEQLGDRLIPDFGLDPDGTTTIDYGPRTFTVGFDEQLRPFVLDQDGKRLKDLPAPGGRDDPDLAPAERKRFMDLKKSVRAVAGLQLRRLENAMVTQRTWNAAEFRSLFVGHPLIGQLARRLLWLAESEGVTTAFRVAEDRTFADIADDGLTLPDDAVIRLPHPLKLEKDLAAWSERFADYEIRQPFAQLERDVFELTEEERADHRLTRFDGVVVPTTRLLGLVPRGWERGAPQDNGVERWISRKLGPDCHLVLAPGRGIAVGMVAAAGESQTIEKVWLAKEPGDYWPGGDQYPTTFGSLDPVTASEALADLAWLTAG
jgi:Domain of unknown function (DUF4132)